MHDTKDLIHLRVAQYVAFNNTARFLPPAPESLRLSDSALYASSASACTPKYYARPRPALL
ncbi:hypothetical protein PsYK624_162120 [Phanerochaete sordida]|uniref:Uncharacterized protein n=1 Tax=Phanerochaete sordida TaxID=48140 RepID=A0A9P3GRP2_9APHY|nr:hypothetical protein PsYK624_162120 [Phanerochaete sordida]